MSVTTHLEARDYLVKEFRRSMVGPGKEEITMLVRPDGNNTQPFLKRDVSFPPIICLIEAVVDEYPHVIGILTVVPADKIVDDEGRPL